MARPIKLRNDDDSVVLTPAPSAAELDAFERGRQAALKEMQQLGSVRAVPASPPSSVLSMSPFYGNTYGISLGTPWTWQQDE